jgi:serine/threonine-protein kinase
MPGTRLGTYEIAAQIGAGGMGEVYRALDTNLGRHVAIKILPDTFAHDPERLARFEREAKTLASLNHPNIAQVYGLEKADGIRALVMELVEGPTLADRIAQGPVPVDEALPIARQIAEALEAAHEKGIVHRDLKPANIKLRPDGTVKVLDFGLAKAADPAGVGSVVTSMSPTITTPAMTQAGVLLGTAAYMSPEQAKGRAVDKRSDIWAFGAVVYEMLTGRRAFQGEDVADTLAAVLMKEPDWTTLPSHTPPAMVTTLQRCLVKDRRLRIRDIGDAMMALGGTFETARESPATPAVVRQIPIWQRPIAIAAMLVVVASIAAVAGWRLTRQPPVPAPVVKFTIVPPANAPLAGGTDPAVIISPDGREVVYTSNAPGSGDTSPGAYFIRRPLDEFSGTPLAITVPSQSGLRGGVNSPFFSPDGKWLGFLDSLTGQVLQRAPIDGGLPVTIANSPVRIRGATWDTDNQIVFAADSRGLFRVPADGGTAVAIAQPDTTKGEAGYRWPSFIPGRRAILFTITDLSTAQALEANQLAVLEVASGAVTRLGIQGMSPQYVSTGHLVYAGADGTLREVRFDLRSLKIVGNPVRLLENLDVKSTGAANFAVSETRSLVYANGAGSAQTRRTLEFVDTSGQRETLKIPPDFYVSPRLSPDGRRLAVGSLTESGGAAIWTYDLTGNTQGQQLTFKGHNRRPIWTPNGERITFASDRDGTWSLYWQPADGHAEAERLTTAAEGEIQWPGSWSPEGTLTFMTQYKGNVYTISALTRTAAGWKTEPLLAGAGRVYLAPEFSPDGKWLAYGSGPNFNAQDIYVEPFPRTGQVIRISRNGGYWPLWSRNTDRLFYRGISTSLGNRLRSVAIATKPSFRFSTESLLPIMGFNVVILSRDYDITPDGKRLLMAFPIDRRSGDEGIINVVMNWNEELKRVGTDVREKR